MESNKLQLPLANALLAAFVVIGFLIVRDISTHLELAMFFASIITVFYFWWGYSFLAMKMPNTKIHEYFYDFVVIVFLMGLFYWPTVLYSGNAVLWLYNYLVIFFLTIIKYALLFLKYRNLKIKLFCLRKIKIDSLAIGFIIVFTVLAVRFNYELWAIWLIFLMELIHILYVGFSGFYKKLDL